MYRLLFSLCCGLLVFPCATAAQPGTNNQGTMRRSPLEVISEMYEAYDLAYESFTTIQRVQSIVQQIDAGLTPDVAGYGSDWSKLANGYRSAAAKVRELPLVTEFDASEFSISAAQLADCSRKTENMGILRRYQEQLARAVEKGRADLRVLNTEMTRADASAEAIRYLIATAQKGAQLPLLGKLFEWDWYALQAGVSPALGDYRQSLNAESRRLQAAVEAAERHYGNLAHNTNLLESSLCSTATSAAGTYVGHLNNQHGTYTYTLTLTAGPGGLRGTYVTRRPSGSTSSQTVSNVSINGSRITFLLRDSGGDQRTRTGTISSDYRVISLNALPGGQPVTLRR